jgi:hypothetical protein
MTKKQASGGNSTLSRKSTSQKYVVAESEIHDFVGSVGVLDINTIAARLQIVADLTSGAFEERIDQLSHSDLALIQRIAEEDTGVHHQRLMKAIIAGVHEGRQGINAAHLTASRVVELAFRCTRDYFSALHSYRRAMRLRLLDRPTRIAKAARRAGHRARLD